MERRKLSLNRINETTILTDIQLKRLIGGAEYGSGSDGCLDLGKSCNANEQCCTKFCLVDPNDTMTGKSCIGIV